MYFLKKYIFTKISILIVFLSIFWIYSLFKDKSNFNLTSIFSAPTKEEARILSEKKGLDTSKIKIIYLNKTTILTNRYFNNLFNLFDINSYFFNGHPREDISDKVFRYKYPWILVFPFIIGIWKLKINKFWLLIIILLPILKNADGWDIILSIPISLIIINGFNNLKLLWINLKK